MQEKLLNTIILAMEMKKICKDNSKLPALVLENASIEAAKDINNYVTLHRSTKVMKEEKRDE